MGAIAPDPFDVDGLCARIERADPAIHAFVAEPGRADRLTEQAGRRQRRWADTDRPPLYGVAVGVKDVFRVDGLPTRAGSRLPADALQGAEAAAVTRLGEAGAIVAGKTVTAEFAFFAPGPTRNPRNLQHTPGGSSSGSAAAVAAGMVPLALGTQTIASVIRPAAYCGVAGFRPSYGRVPSDGVIAFAPSLDTVGWFAPDVAGLTDAAAVLCDQWQGDQRRGDQRRGDQRQAGRGSAAPRPEPATRPDQASQPELGIPAGPYLEHAGAEALAAFAAQAGRLRQAGFAVRDVPVLDDFGAVRRQLFVISRYELAREHAARFARYGELYRPQTAAAIRDGQAITAGEYAEALAGQRTLRRELAATMRAAAIDAWITPAACGPAPAGLDSTGDPVMSVPWSLAGLPAVSLPAGLVAGLPVGVQCVGHQGGDEQLLARAGQVEAALAGPRAS
jgi:Asp-tRNA(Asn)/Glu-tRNA(Gln) amidotransferase A subunit family amidase